MEAQPVTSVDGDDDSAGDDGDGEATPLVEEPLFWGGIAGGTALLVGAGVGTGFLIYYLLGSDTGTIVVTLE